jgi:hypothetical protein
MQVAPRIIKRYVEQGRLGKYEPPECPLRVKAIDVEALIRQSITEATA